MGLVSFSHPSLFASFTAPLRSPAQGLVRWLRLVTHPHGHEAQRQPPVTARRQLGQSVRSTNRRPSSFTVKNPLCGDSPFGTPSVNRLKVVREADSAVRRGGAGRMMISGRMADVCAELDRMVQSETGAVAKRQG